MTGEGGGKPKIVTNGDKGGRGSKNLIFAVTSFLNAPLKPAFISAALILGIDIQEILTS